MAPAPWAALPTTSMRLSDSTDLSPALLGEGYGAAALRSRLSEPGVLHMSCRKPGREVKGASGSVGAAWGDRAVGLPQHLGGTGGTQLQTVLQHPHGFTQPTSPLLCRSLMCHKGWGQEHGYAPTPGITKATHSYHSSSQAASHKVSSLLPHADGAARLAPCTWG